MSLVVKERFGFGESLIGYKISALCSSGVSIRIEYMDQSQAPSGGWHHDFLVEGDNQPKLFFLYRPGHYDILYRSDSTELHPTVHTP